MRVCNLALISADPVESRSACRRRRPAQLCRLARPDAPEPRRYILSFGPSEFTGFLTFKECTDDKGTPRQLARGAQLRVAVASIDKPNRVIHVAAQGREVKAAVSAETAGLTFTGLLPGMLVNARVRAVLSDGLLLAFLTYFTGTVDLLNMEDPLQTAGQLASSFVENQRLRARILYVDPTNKRVGLTLSKPLVQLSELPPLPPIGAVIENAVVRRLDTAVGLLCELKGDAVPGASAAGYAHVRETSSLPRCPQPPGQLSGGEIASNAVEINSPRFTSKQISQLSDSRVEKLEKAFKRGQKVRARVIGHRLMDGLAALTLKPSVLDQAYLSFEEIRCGPPPHHCAQVAGWWAPCDLSEKTFHHITLCLVMALQLTEFFSQPGRGRDGQDRLHRATWSLRHSRCVIWTHSPRRAGPFGTVYAHICIRLSDSPSPARLPAPLRGEAPRPGTHVARHRGWKREAHLKALQGAVSPLAAHRRRTCRNRVADVCARRAHVLCLSLTSRLARQSRAAS